MRILFVHSRFSIKNLRKQPWYLSYGLAKQLRKRGHDVELITDVKCNVEGLNTRTVEPSKLRLQINSLRKYFENSDAILYFGNSLSGLYLRRLKQGTPIILQANSMHYTIQELRALSSKDTRSHLVHLFYSIPPLSFSVRLLNRRLVSTIVVPNAMIKDRFVKFGVNSEKMRVIPTPFETKSLLNGLENKEEIRERLGLSDEFLVTYLGSPRTIRGTDTILKAARILKGRIGKLKILLLSRVDSPSEWREERYLASLTKRFALYEIVQSIPGVLERKEVQNYIQASDLITLPFKIVQSEPPLAILESMALRKPVITTRTCGLPEIISPKRGALIKPSDSEELAETILDFYRYPERAKIIGTNAQKFVSNLPSWKDVTDQYESLLKELSSDVN